MEVKWIKLTTDVFDNEKIRMIEKMPDGDTLIVCWMKLLVLAGKTNNNGFVFFASDIPYTDEMLSVVFNRPLQTVKLALSTFERFHMIETTDSIIHVSNWEKYQNVDGLEKIREQNRKRVAAFREREKLKRICNVTSNGQVMLGNGIEEEKEKELEEDYITPRAQEIIDLFNGICASFPKVKTLSDARKRAIKARLKHHSIAEFELLFRRAENSDFLKGKNGHGWRANFDWLINENNMAKVLDGNYDDRLTGTYDVIGAWANETQA